MLFDGEAGALVFAVARAGVVASFPTKSPPDFTVSRSAAGLVKLIE